MCIIINLVKIATFPQSNLIIIISLLFEKCATSGAKTLFVCLCLSLETAVARYIGLLLNLLDILFDWNSPDSLNSVKQ